MSKFGTMDSLEIVKDSLTIQTKESKVINSKVINGTGYKDYEFSGKIEYTTPTEGSQEEKQTIKEVGIIVYYPKYGTEKFETHSGDKKNFKKRVLLTEDMVFEYAAYVKFSDEVIVEGVKVLVEQEQI